MDEDQLKRAIELGRRAKETKQFLESNPYLKEVMERIRMNLIAGIMSLRGDQAHEFAAMKAAYDMALEPLAYIEGDILMGERASKELEAGKPVDEGGIL